MGEVGDFFEDAVDFAVDGFSDVVGDFIPGGGGDFASAFTGASQALNLAPIGTAIAAIVSVLKEGINTLGAGVAIPLGGIHVLLGRMLSEAFPELRAFQGNFQALSRDVVNLGLKELLPESARQGAATNAFLGILLQQGLPLLLKASGVFDVSGARPLERLIAGTVYGPRQMGASMVRAYYANPRAVASHLTNVQAEASTSFLRAVARARPIA